MKLDSKNTKGGNRKARQQKQADKNPRKSDRKIQNLRTKQKAMGNKSRNNKESWGANTGLGNRCWKGRQTNRVRENTDLKEERAVLEKDTWLLSLILWLSSTGTNRSGISTISYLPRGLHSIPLNKLGPIQKIQRGQGKDNDRKCKTKYDTLACSVFILCKATCIICFVGCTTNSVSGISSIISRRSGRCVRFLSLCLASCPWQLDMTSVDN